MLNSFLDRFTKAHVTPKPMAEMVSALAWAGLIFLFIFIFAAEPDDTTLFWERVLLFFGCIYSPLGFWWLHIFERNGPGNRGIYSTQRYIGFALLYCFIPFGFMVGILVYFCVVMMGVDALWNDLVTEARSTEMKAFGGFVAILLNLGLITITILALGGLYWALKNLITYGRQGAFILTLSKEHLYEGDDCLATIEIKKESIIEPKAELRCVIFYMRSKRAAALKELHSETLDCIIEDLDDTSNLVISFKVPENIHDQAEAVNFFSLLNVRIDVNGTFESSDGKRSKFFRVWRLNVLPKAYKAEFETVET